MVFDAGTLSFFESIIEVFCAIEAEINVSFVADVAVSAGVAEISFVVLCCKSTTAVLAVAC